MEGDAKVRERILMNVRLLEGKSLYEVGDEFRCVPSKAHYWKKRFKEGGEDLRDHPRSGRPRLISSGEEKVVQHIIERPCITRKGLACWTNKSKVLS